MMLLNLHQLQSDELGEQYLLYDPPPVQNFTRAELNGLMFQYPLETQE